MRVKIKVWRVPDTGELFDVPIKLNFSGPCPNFSEGQEFILDDDAKPEGFCRDAWYTLLPYIMAIRRGAEFPDYFKEPGKGFFCCPDAARPVSFLVERL